MWGFFYVARMDEVFTGQGWAAATYPAGGDPSPSAPGQTAQHGQQGRPCQMQGRPRHAPTHTPGHWTRCTGLHSIPDRPRRADRTGGRRCNVSGKVYNFGRSILSIFIWIYFAKSIDNPYIYGYNTISPDKYGLQPQYTKTGGQNHESKKNHAGY